MSKADTRRRMRNANEYRSHFYRSDKTKMEMTLDYLYKFKTITQLEALQAFGSFRLSDSIYKLRNSGYVITTKFAEGDCNYAIYTLEA